eukprot:CAMPEP_0184671240 /NCGR_PEP_ID=MMETSP0308-20130426/85379_1 /TAXON_ID=38269 /ORGANISM="Gloeochaete witrockiana, Strain SAG 46.84" /LENGTH=716 /DNA_ID=CAMNT_0027118325 /DNA_START=92 /DNA_END=2242 /DNA_ORIENTATION=-
MAPRLPFRLAFIALLLISSPFCLQAEKNPLEDSKTVEHVIDSKTTGDAAGYTGENHNSGARLRNVPDVSTYRCSGIEQINATEGGVEFASNLGTTYEPSSNCTWEIYAPKNHYVQLEFNGFFSLDKADVITVHDKNGLKLLEISSFFASVTSHPPSRPVVLPPPFLGFDQMRLRESDPPVDFPPPPPPPDVDPPPGPPPAPVDPPPPPPPPHTPRPTPRPFPDEFPPPLPVLNLEGAGERITFSSRNVFRYQVFSAVARAVLGPLPSPAPITPSPIPTPLSADPIFMCSGTRTIYLDSYSSRATIASNWGGLYQNDISCVWSIVAPGYDIFVNVASLYLSDNVDALTLSDNSTAVLWRGHPSLLPSMTLKEYATIVFSSGRFGRHSGFVAELSAVPPSTPTPTPIYCSGTVEINATVAGVQFSSNTGGYYNPSSRCAWLISPPANHFLRLKFTSIETDSVAVNVLNENAQQIDLLPPIYGDGSLPVLNLARARVTFLSGRGLVEAQGKLWDFSPLYTGFTAVAMAVPGPVPTKTPTPSAIPCARPPGWCTEPGASYKYVDCNEDGGNDHWCEYDGGVAHVIAPDTCEDLWGVTYIDCPGARPSPTPTLTSSATVPSSTPTPFSFCKAMPDNGVYPRAVCAAPRPTNPRGAPSPCNGRFPLVLNGYWLYPNDAGNYPDNKGCYPDRSGRFPNPHCSPPLYPLENGKYPPCPKRKTSA